MDANFLNLVLAASVALLALLAIGAFCFYVFGLIWTRRQHARALKVQKSLAEGQKVAFGGGLVGTLVHVGSETCDVKVKSGAVIEVARYAVQSIDAS